MKNKENNSVYQSAQIPAFAVVVLSRPGVPGKAMGDEKRARTGGTMPPEMKKQIETSLDAMGQIKLKKRSHKKGSGPVQAKCRPADELIHDRGSAK